MVKPNIYIFTHGFCNSLMTDIIDPFSEFQDIYREDTIKTYQEWLGVEGKLDDISNIPLLIVKQITILCQTLNYASSSCDKIVCRCVFESYHSYTFQSRQQPNTSSAATISCSALDTGARKW